MTQKMKKRKIIISLGAFLIIATTSFLTVATTFGLMGLKKNEREQSDKKVNAMPLKQVVAVEVKNRTYSWQLPITGRIQPNARIDLYSEVSGKVLASSKPFKEGVNFKKGEVLVQLDAEEQELNLKSQKSAFLQTLVQIMPDLKMDFPEDFDAWDNYLAGFNIENNIVKLPNTPKSKLKYFLASNKVYDQYYSIRAKEKNLAKYCIKAPFTGTLINASANPGMLVNSQLKLGEFSSTDSYELEAAVSLADRKYVHVGDQVQLKSSDKDGDWEGKIVRISNAVDGSSQNISIFIEVNDAELIEGMFLEGSIEITDADQEKLTEISKEALVHSNQVYVIKDSVVRLTSIEPVKYLTSTIWVRGLKDGQLFLNEYTGEPMDGTKVGVKIQ